MSFNTTFAAGFYTGAGTSADVPSLYPVALDGHPYIIDRSSDGYGRWVFRHETIPLLKQQQQSDGKLGENSINPGGLWRSSIETWHKGAGQTYYDLADSDPARFRQSKGVDPWTKWNLSLLPDTSQLASSANTNLQLAATSTRLFWLDGTAIKYTDDLSSVSTMTGTKPWVSIATDGYNVYATDGSDIYTWLRTATTTSTAWNTTDVDLLVWVRGKGRLMASKGASVYNVTSSSAPSDIKPSVISSDFTWVGFAEGPSVIYGAGYQGNKSLIFRWGVKSDGTIDVAIPALTDGLPDGEIVYSIASYLGFVLIGTDKGIRFAIPDASTGNLTIGSLITLSIPIRCFTAAGSFVWFGWTNYDSTSTGLGRLSLTTFSDVNSLVPAYASDLMTTAQGDVLSVTSFLGKRVYAVSGSGIVAESADLVSSGTMQGGWRSFSIPDNKVALLLDIRHDSLPAGASVAASVAVDGSSTYATVLNSVTTSATGANVPVGEITGQRFEVKYLLGRATVTTTGPVIAREVLSMNPTADNGFMVILPALLNEVDGLDQGNRRRDVASELAFLQALRSSRRVVTYQEGSTSYAVSLEDYDWFPREPTTNRSAYQGTCVLSLKVVSL